MEEMGEKFASLYYMHNEPHWAVDILVPNDAGGHAWRLLHEGKETKTGLEWGIVGNSPLEALENAYILYKEAWND